MSSVRIQKASAKDIPLIHELATHIWKLHYPDIISMDQIDYMLALMYSPQSLGKQMNDGYVFHLVLQDEKPVGYISIGEKTPGDYFLSKFYIDPACQGKGIGKEVFGLVLKEFPPMKTMRLQVNRRNFKSVNFYFRLGFIIESTMEFDIGSGYSMDDFVMLKRF